MDPVTEAIAHFVGLFNLHSEEARLRAEYNDFKAKQAAARAEEDLSYLPRNMKAPHPFDDFDPKSHYVSEGDPLPPPVPPPHIKVPDVPPPLPDQFPLTREYGPEIKGPGGGSGAGSGLGRPEDELIQPHNLGIYIEQANYLEDHDYLNMTDVKVEFDDSSQAWIKLAALTAKAQELDRLFHDADLSSEQGIADFIEQTRQILPDIADYTNEDAEIFVDYVEANGGTVVNGEVVADAPALKDYLPDVFNSPADETIDEENSALDLDGGEDGTATWTTGDSEHADAHDDDAEAPLNEASGNTAESAGALDLKAKVDATTGANLMVNESIMVSSWNVAPAIVVMGDVTDVNVISQVNVYSDKDSVNIAPAQLNTSASTGTTTGNGAGNGTTTAHNVAAFTVEPITSQEVEQLVEEETTEDSIFPTDWVVTSYEGNVVFMNWAEQYSFLSDADTAVLSTSGSSMINLGGNWAFNEISLSELGNYFDLISIGGSYLHANIISQTNILLDDDMLKSTGKGKGKGNDKGNSEGQIDADGNLLWNEASIHGIGKKHYKNLDKDFEQAGKSLVEGKPDLSDNVLNSEMFAGLEGLRVLHISGDLIDLQYIRQTNVLGDADQVALMQEQFIEGTHGEWVITTGKNALVNLAKIVDVGVDSTIMVGGEQYSDALLYQANLISEEPELSAGDPLQLANEAVAFLAEDMVVNPDNPDAAPLVLDNDPTSPDVMETVLA